MKVMSGTVVGGRVKVPPESAAEGKQVMILVPEHDRSFRLTAHEEDELLEAMEEIRRGDFVDGAELLEEIRPRGKA